MLKEKFYGVDDAADQETICSKGSTPLFSFLIKMDRQNKKRSNPNMDPAHAKYAYVFSQTRRPPKIPKTAADIFLYRSRYYATYSFQPFPVMLGLSSIFWSLHTYPYI